MLNYIYIICNELGKTEQLQIIENDKTLKMPLSLSCNSIFQMGKTITERQIKRELSKLPPWKDPPPGSSADTARYLKKQVAERNRHFLNNKILAQALNFNPTVELPSTGESCEGDGTPPPPPPPPPPPLRGGAGGQKTSLPPQDLCLVFQLFSQNSFIVNFTFQLPRLNGYGCNERCGCDGQEPYNLSFFATVAMRLNWRDVGGSQMLGKSLS